MAGEVDPAWPSESLSEARADELVKDMLAGAARPYRYFAQDRAAHAQAQTEVNQNDSIRTNAWVRRSAAMTHALVRAARNTNIATAEVLSAAEPAA